jgi:hypothetical protein
MLAHGASETVNPKEENPMLHVSIARTLLILVMALIAVSAGCSDPGGSNATATKVVTVQIEGMT